MTLPNLDFRRDILIIIQCEAGEDRRESVAILCVIFDCNERPPCRLLKRFDLNLQIWLLSWDIHKLEILWPRVIHRNYFTCTISDDLHSDKRIICHILQYDFRLRYIVYKLGRLRRNIDLEGLLNDWASTFLIE